MVISPSRAVSSAVLAGAAVPAVLALSRLDRGPLTVPLAATAPVALLAAYPVLLDALARRRWPLALLAAGEVAVHVRLLAPPARPLPPGPDGFSFRVASLNLLHSNSSSASDASEVASWDPDVVVLVEHSTTSSAGVRSSGLWDRYPSRFEFGSGSGGLALLSRLPVEDVTVVAFPSRPLLSARLLTPAGPVRLLGVHAPLPVGRRRHRRWVEQLGTLPSLLPPGEAALVVGDFNATSEHTVFSDMLTRAGLADAADLLRVRALTWPSGRFALPLTRPDHVLVGEGLVPTGLRVGRRRSSDHRALCADVVVRAS